VSLFCATSYDSRAFFNTLLVMQQKQHILG
jgi:hypothetical protein